MNKICAYCGCPQSLCRSDCWNYQEYMVGRRQRWVKKIPPNLHDLKMLQTVTIPSGQIYLIDWKSRATNVMDNLAALKSVVDTDLRLIERYM